MCTDKGVYWKCECWQRLELIERCELYNGKKSGEACDPSGRKWIVDDTLPKPDLWCRTFLHNNLCQSYIIKDARCYLHDAVYHIREAATAERDAIDVKRIKALTTGGGITPEYSQMVIRDRRLRATEEHCTTEIGGDPQQKFKTSAINAIAGLLEQNGVMARLRAQLDESM